MIIIYSSPSLKTLRLVLLTATLLTGAGYVRAQAPSPRTLHNLETFARLYGYVRYFHPSDEAAAVDWSRFLPAWAKPLRAASPRQRDGSISSQSSHFKKHLP